jgi:iron complex outermembrane recepter protein
MKSNRCLSSRAGWAGASLLIIAACAVPASAQTPDAAPAADASVSAAPGDIVVTATRRRELAKDVPVAVSSISGDKLDVLNSSGLDVRFLSSRVPSLQIESSFGRTFPRFYVRGLGNTDFDPNAAQPVSVVYDDVALESPMLKSFPVFDLQSVQVLRGPQGTLFGRNTPAGVVKLDPKLPGDVTEGYAQAEYGSYGTFNGEMGVGGPTGVEGLSYRVSGIMQSRDNWVKNDDTSNIANGRLEGYKDVAGRGHLQYKSGDFTARVEGHIRHLDGSPRIFRAGLFRTGSNHFNDGFDIDHVALDNYTSQSLRQWGANLHLDYHFEGLGTLYSITGYERASVESTGDIDGGNAYGDTTPSQLNVGGFPDVTGGLTRPREFSQELRFASDQFGRVRIQGGGYYFRQRLSYEEFAYATPNTGVRADDLNQALGHRNLNENYGIFASGEWKATDAFTLRAGVRYSHDRKHDVITDLMPHGLPSANVFGTVLPSEARVKGSAVTWDASGTYAVTSDVNVYARVATGYLGPAIQDRVTFGSQQTTAKKQTTLSAEAGIKGNTPDRLLGFSVDGYWWRTKNLQLTAVGGASNSARLLNADHAVGYGAEAEIDLRPAKGLTISASGSYNFTEIRDPSIGVAPCGGGCTVTDPLDANGNAIINGNDLPQAPRYVFNATLRYVYPLTNGDSVFFDTDWAYRGKINYFLYTAKEFRGRALTEGGAELGYNFKDKVQVSVFARNIANQIRALSAIDFNNLTGMVNDPRIIGGKVRVTF